MSITGAPDDAGGQPTKVGVAISDLASGLFGAVAVVAALYARDRGSPGAVAPAGAAGEERPGAAGQRVDVTLLGSTLALLVNQAQNAFVTGRPPVRRGNVHPNIAPYQTFATADGSIALGVGSERQWARLCSAIGRPELVADSRFATNGDRVEHRAALGEILEPVFAANTTQTWLSALAAAEVPAGPINDLLAAFEEPASRRLGMRVGVEHPRLGRLDQVAPPFALSGTPASIRTPPPLLGEHADAILDELGYGGSEIDELRRDGVV
jgi:crotonobetainyl-CoA:carnitine CoA-transferase CaiB-like acyl-CoA transferase